MYIKKALNVEEVPTLSFTTINSSGFFFLSNIKKKKIMWSGDQKKKPRKGNHLSFLASFLWQKNNFFAERIPEHDWSIFVAPMKMWIAFHSSKTWVHFK